LFLLVTIQLLKGDEKGIVPDFNIAEKGIIKRTGIKKPANIGLAGKGEVTESKSLIR
jgi:hypothetical protein